MAMSDGGDPGEIHVVETIPDADASGDVIGARPPRTPGQWSIPPSWLAGLLAVVLLAGLGVGYLIGHSGRSKPAAAPTRTQTLVLTPLATESAPLPAGSALAEIPQSALAVGTGTCTSMDAGTGRVLVLGFQLVNRGPRTVALTSARAMFPLGGLRLAEIRVGHCETRSGHGLTGQHIAPGATLWLTLDLAVQVRCPAALPVELQVDYSVGGAPSTQVLLPYPDLGQVPYHGCPS
jgi:hypothetical protein